MFRLRESYKISLHPHNTIGFQHEINKIETFLQGYWPCSIRPLQFLVTSWLLQNKWQWPNHGPRKFAWAIEVIIFLLSRGLNPSLPLSWMINLTS